MNIRKAAEMALSRLEHTIAYSNEEMQKIDEAKHALRQALAQPEQKTIKQSYLDGLNSGIKAERERCAKIALTGTGEPVQVATLEILKKERERIAGNILEISND